MPRRVVNVTCDDLAGFILIIHTHIFCAQEQVNFEVKQRAGFRRVRNIAESDSGCHHIPSVRLSAHVAQLGSR